jgi:hypothetical protein
MTVTTVLLLYFFSRKQKRHDPLKSSTRATVEFCSRFRSAKLVIYLPSKQFVSKMKAALDIDVAKLELFLKKEDAVFFSTWDAMAKDDKLHLTNRLWEELSESLEPYSDSWKFLDLLCPDLTQEFVMSGVGPDGRNGVDRLFKSIFDKKSHLYVEPVIVTNARRFEENLDPNNIKIDTELIGETHSFLNVLRPLAITRFTRELLLRYKHKQSFWRKHKSLVVAGALGVLAIAVVGLLFYMGILQKFFWGFQ